MKLRTIFDDLSNPTKTKTTTYCINHSITNLYFYLNYLIFLNINFLNWVLIQMKYQLVILVFLFVTGLGQNPLTATEETRPKLSEEFSLNHTSNIVQDLLAQIPNNNKPVSLLDPAKYSNNTTLLAAEDPAQRPTEKNQNRKEAFANSTEKVQFKNSQIRSRQSKQEGESGLTLKQTEKQQEKGNKSFLKQELQGVQSIKNINDIDHEVISQQKVAQKVKNQNQVKKEEILFGKTSAKESQNQKVQSSEAKQLTNQIKNEGEVQKQKKETQYSDQSKISPKIAVNGSTQANKGQIIAKTEEETYQTQSLTSKKGQKMTKQEKSSNKKGDNKESNDKSSQKHSQPKPEKLQSMRNAENDIKIIPLSAEYGKDKSKQEQKSQEKFNTTISKGENKPQKSNGKNETQLNLYQQRRQRQSKSKVKNIQKQHQKQTKQSKNESQNLQKLIQEVKNTKNELPYGSKQQIIKYLQTKKFEHSQKDDQKPDPIIMSSQKSNLAEQKPQARESQQYAIVVDDVIQINQKSKSNQQMNNSTIFVIMILTVLISIPIFREIRSRNDNSQDSSQDLKLNKEADGIMSSKQDLEKPESSKYYNELNYQLGEEINERMYEEII